MCRHYFRYHEVFIASPQVRPFGPPSRHRSPPTHQPHPSAYPPPPLLADRKPITQREATGKEYIRDKRHVVGVIHAHTNMHTDTQTYTHTRTHTHRQASRHTHTHTDIQKGNGPSVLTHTNMCAAVVRNGE